MNGSFEGLRLVGIASCVFTAPLFADLPPVVDQIPADTAVFAIVNNVSSLLTDIEGLQGVAKGGMQMMELEEGLGFLKNLDGVNLNGSAAFLVIGGAEGGMGGEPPVVALIPVTNFQQMLTSAGADEFDGLHAVVLNEETVYLREAGAGFAAVSPFEDAVRSFTPSAGNTAAHVARLGKVGDSLVNSADVVLVADMGSVGHKLQEGFDNGIAQAQMMMMMGGQAMPDTEAIEAAVTAMIDNAQVGMIGFDASPAGVGMHVAANFKPGTETAQAFAGSGTQTNLMSRLPADPFLFAMSLDMTTPVMGELMDLFKNMNPDKAMENPLFNEADGMAMLISLRLAACLVAAC